ncbi:MAG: histidinol dehydrogenase, partial [bacterium]
MLSRYKASESDPDFTAQYPLEDADEEVTATVTSILRDIQSTGWESVEKYSRKFDETDPGESPIESSRFDDAWSDLSPRVQEAFRTARSRVIRYQRAIKPSSTLISDGDSKLGEVVRPLQTVGCYI